MQCLRRQVAAGCLSASLLGSSHRHSTPASAHSQLRAAPKLFHRFYMGLLALSSPPMRGDSPQNWQNLMNASLHTSDSHTHDTCCTPAAHTSPCFTSCTRLAAALLASNPPLQAQPLPRVWHTRLPHHERASNSQWCAGNSHSLTSCASRPQLPFKARHTTSRDTRNHTMPCITSCAS